MTDDELWLHTLCRKNGIFITDIQLSRLSRFRQELLDWNAKINLVSRKNEENLWRGHIALSLTMLFNVSFREGSRILDLGTGGGFPGIPLAVMLPGCSFMLLDSTQKKVNAVRAMADAIGLTNVETVWGRAEEVNADARYREGFDAVVARSVSRLSNLLDWGWPFLKRDGGGSSDGGKAYLTVPSLVTFKGQEIEEEEREARRGYPSLRFRSVPLVFPGSEEFDHLDKKLVIVTRS